MRSIERLFGWLVSALLARQEGTAPKALERQLKRVQLIAIAVLVCGTAVLSLFDSWLPKYDARGVENTAALAIANIGFVLLLLIWAGGLTILLVADSMRKRIKPAVKATK